MAIHKNRAPVCMHWLPSTKSESQAPCSIELTRRSRIEVPRVDYEKLSGNRVSESSEAIRARVQAARDIQEARFTNPESRLSNNGSSTDIVCNADMRVGEIRQFCRLQACPEQRRRDEGQSLMRAATTQLNLSARAYHRILKLARTIADLAGSEEIQSPHLAEALHLRRPKIMTG